MLFEITGLVVGIGNIRVESVLVIRDIRKTRSARMSLKDS